jgi:hypothetical protein
LLCGRGKIKICILKLEIADCKVMHDLSNILPHNGEIWHFYWDCVGEKGGNVFPPILKQLYCLKSCGNDGEGTYFITLI